MGCSTSQSASHTRIEPPAQYNVDNVCLHPYLAAQLRPLGAACLVAELCQIQLVFQNGSLQKYKSALKVLPNESVYGTTGQEFLLKVFLMTGRGTVNYSDRALNAAAAIVGSTPFAFRKFALETLLPQHLDLMLCPITSILLPGSLTASHVEEILGVSQETLKTSTGCCGGSSATEDDQITNDSQSLIEVSEESMLTYVALGGDEIHNVNDWDEREDDDDSDFLLNAEFGDTKTHRQTVGEYYLACATATLTLDAQQSKGNHLNDTASETTGKSSRLKRLQIKRSSRSSRSVRNEPEGPDPIHLQAVCGAISSFSVVCDSLPGLFVRTPQLGSFLRYVEIGGAPQWQKAVMMFCFSPVTWRLIAFRCGEGVCSAEPEGLTELVLRPFLHRASNLKMLHIPGSSITISFLDVLKEEQCALSLRSIDIRRCPLLASNESDLVTVFQSPQDKPLEVKNHAEKSRVKTFFEGVIGKYSESQSKSLTKLAPFGKVFTLKCGPFSVVSRLTNLMEIKRQNRTNEF